VFPAIPFFPKFTALDGAGEKQSTYANSSITVTEPGRYEISFGELGGFEQIPDQTITVTMR
jgi:hypothetical protein